MVKKMIKKIKKFDKKIKIKQYKKTKKNPQVRHLTKKTFRGVRYYYQCD